MRIHPPSRRSARLLVVGMFVWLFAAAFATMPASSATSSTTIGATILSAVSLDDSSCRSSAALDLGSVTINAWAIGAACDVTFGSSNDTARLSIWQRDEKSPALESMTTTWTPRSGSTNWNSTAAGTTAGYAWAGGYGGPGEPASRLEKTIDGGATWTLETTCDGNAPVDIEALSDTLLYLTTGGSICRTTDGGATWNSVFSGSGVVRLDMVSATVGYAIVNTNIYKTTDGVTWAQVHANATFNYLGAISATPGGSIVVSGRTSALPNSTFGVVYSTDAGATWTSQVLDTSAGLDTYGVFGSLAISDTTLLVSTPRGRWLSTDSGATWPVNPVGTFSGEPFVRSDGVIFASTGGDLIARSSDGGASWTNVTLGLGLGVHNRQVAGIGLSELWVVGYDDRRLHSGDAGATWTAVSPPKPAWGAVAAWNADRWVAASRTGTATRTTDNGATFTTPVLGTTQAIRDGIALHGGIGVLVGSSIMLRTTDFGATWSTITPPVAGVDWTEIVLDDADQLWIAGQGGRVARSTNHGVSWTLETIVPGAPGLDALGVWRGQVWVGGSAGAIWRSSTTAPLAWTAVPTGLAPGIISIWPIDATTAVALTGNDVGTGTAHVSRTTDSGATWTSANTAITFPRDIAIDDAHRFGWITGPTNYAASEDRGITWGALKSVGVGNYVDRMEVLNGGRLVAVGDGALISTSSPVLGVPDGMGGAGSGFGACLETAAGTLTTGWVLAGAGNCIATNPGSWTAIAQDANAATALVATTATGATATLRLRFGIRTSATQTTGSYAASLLVEAVAPAV